MYDIQRIVPLLTIFKQHPYFAQAKNVHLHLKRIFHMTVDFFRTPWVLKFFPENNITKRFNKVWSVVCLEPERQLTFQPNEV